MVIPKPQLRGLLSKDIRRNVPASIVAGVLAAVAVKFLYNDPLKQTYADFYKNYDANEAFERMRKKGLFQSCDP